MRFKQMIKSLRNGGSGILSWTKRTPSGGTLTSIRLPVRAKPKRPKSGSDPQIHFPEGGAGQRHGQMSPFWWPPDPFFRQPCPVLHLRQPTPVRQPDEVSEADVRAEFLADGAESTAKPQNGGERIGRKIKALTVSSITELNLRFL